MARGYRASIHFGNLAAENTRTVGTWARSAQGDVVRIARATAPKRGGWKTEGLAARHRGWVTKRGSYDWNVIVLNDASYALYPHEGTTGPITARNGRYMVFPGREIGVARTTVRLRSVRGQRSQPWLRDALTTVMRSRGVTAPVRHGAASQL